MKNGPQWSAPAAEGRVCTARKRLRRLVWLSTMILALAAFAAAGRAAPPAGAAVTDADINRAVADRLRADPDVSDHLIDVDTERGIVTLSGVVANLLEKDRAVRVAESVRGVRAVVATLAVRAPERSDPEIRRDVREALRQDPDIDFGDVTVIVADGVVTLGGAADSWVESRLAQRAAKSVRGVRRTENRIAVSYDMHRPDEEIRRDVVRRLAGDVFVDDDRISVAVDDGRVTLGGAVGSAAEKSRAQNDAFVVGAAAVDASGLRVQWRRGRDMRKRQAYAALTDEWLKEAVEDALLFDPRVQSFNPKVEVDDGAVTLDGTVESLTAKRAAEKDAWNTLGVRRVDNRLKVRYARWPTDAEARARVLSVFERDALIAKHDLEAEVVNHKAYLYGKVNTLNEKIHAANLATRIHGIVALANHVTVRDRWRWQSDAAIRESVQEELFWSPFVDSDDIAVAVTDGAVRLEGVTSGRFETDAAVQNAFEGGARSVRVNLREADGTLTVEYYPDRNHFYRHADPLGTTFWP